MLPPMLTRVRDQIRRKAVDHRTDEEVELLRELDWLDSKPELRQLTERGVREGYIAKIVSGPGNCPCCGR